MDPTDTSFDELSELCSDLLCIKDIWRKASCNQNRESTLSSKVWLSNSIAVWVTDSLNAPGSPSASFQPARLELASWPTSIQHASFHSTLWSANTQPVSNQLSLLPSGIQPTRIQLSSI